MAFADLDRLHDRTPFSTSNASWSSSTNTLTSQTSGNTGSNHFAIQTYYNTTFKTQVLTRTSTGTWSVNLEKDSTFNVLRFKKNGNVQDGTVDFYCSELGMVNGKTYTITGNVTTLSGAETCICSGIVITEVDSMNTTWSDLYDGMSTRGDAANIAGYYLDDDQLILKSELSSYGCTLNSGSYANNQAVKYSDITGSATYKGLKFRAIGSGSIKMTSNSSNNANMSYSLDDGLTWTTWSTSYPEIFLADGQVICFRGNNTSRFSQSSSKYNMFVINGTMCASGNIMSLIDNGACTTTTIPSNYCFYNLFRNCYGLITAPDLPATTLKTYCYNYMFYGCTSLISPPKELLAPTLTNYCYASMFNGCIRLERTPIIRTSALTGTYSCDGMFQNCTSIKHADCVFKGSAAANCSFRNTFNGCTSLIYPPTVEFTSMSSTAVCRGMFQGCTSLIEMPVLSCTSLNSNGYESMFQGCTSLNKVYDLPATTANNYCYTKMFYGCTSLVSAPKISINTLASYCFNQMFYGCTSLTEAPELSATTLATQCYYQMFYGCTSLVSAPALPATTLTQQCYYQMFYNCSSLNYIYCLASDISATNCTSSWVSGVSITGVFIKDPRMTSWTTGTNGIPSGWCEPTAFTPTTTMTTNNKITLNISSDVIYVGLGKKCSYHTVYGSMNGTNWKELSAGEVFEVDSGEHFYIYGNLSSSPSTSDYTQFIMCGPGLISMSGNCNALWNQSNMSASVRSYSGYMNFRGCTSLGSLSGFVMPNTSAMYSYKQMFMGCTRLTTPPYKIEFETITSQSCYEMFRNCTSLQTAPQLPMTTLAGDYCYAYMFQNCSSLVTAPTLPATTLGSSSSYNSMFMDCRSLVNVPDLPATTLNGYCYNQMFKNCTSLKKAPRIYGTTLTSTYNCANMFQNCINLETPPPELPATTLTNYCYGYMFSGCISLQSIPNLPATTLGTYCYQYMFQNCKSLKGHVTLPATILTNNCYQYMFQNCGSLTSVDIGNGVTVTSIGTSSLTYTFENCTSLKSATMINNSSTYVSNSFNSTFKNCTSLTEVFDFYFPAAYQACAAMFSGCTSLESSPILAATTLASGCYQNMFTNCLSLKEVHCWATNISASNCLNNWMNGVPNDSTRTFYKARETTYPSSASGIPSNWNIVDER